MPGRRLYLHTVRAAVRFSFVAGLVLAGQLEAQQTTLPARLSLEEAIELARRNNPDYLAIKNDIGAAEWGIREAYGNLLPGASLGTGLSYQASGPARFGVFTGADLGISSSPAYYSSDYSVGVDYQLSGASLFGPRRAKSDKRAVEANIVAADFALKANVTRQYLAVVRARDGVVLAQEELKRADENLKLAQGKVAVGAAIPLEAKQAEVERGRAEVTLLQSRNLVRTETLRLMQQIGIELSRDVELTTQFGEVGVFELGVTEEELVQFAMQSHPDMAAARAFEESSEAGVKMARSAYLPSLSMSAGFSGYTRQAGRSDRELISQAEQQLAGQRASCEQQNLISAGLTRPLPGFPRNCSAMVLTPDQERSIIEGNDVFPFSFTRQPWSAGLRVSVPVFQGFGRERQVEQARASVQDARFRLRSQELRLRTEISAAYLNATTAQQSVALEV